MARKFLTGIDLQNQRAVNLADGSSLTDAVTLQQLNNAITGLNWKPRVRVASTANVTIASALVNASTIDGTTLATGDRVLLKNQTTATENGIYVVVASGAASRATDADISSEVRNMIVGVETGTVNGDTIWQLVTDAPTLGTTSLTFTQFQAGIVYSAGNGLQLASNAFSVLLDTASGLITSGTGLKIDFTNSAFIKRYAGDVPSGSTTATITHNLGTVDRAGQPCVTIKSTGEVVDVDILLGTNADTLTFITAPTTSQYRYSTAA